MSSCMSMRTTRANVLKEQRLLIALHKTDQARHDQGQSGLSSWVLWGLHFSLSAV